MEFIDRVPTKPNRVKLTFEDTGSTSYAFVERADEPTEEGTPLNRNTFEAMQKDLLGFRRELTSVENLDNLLDDGVYFYTTATVQNGLGNAPFKNAAVVVVFGGKSKTTQKIQIAFRYGEAGHGKFRALYNNGWHQWADFMPGLEDVNFSGCYYRFVDGEKEWVNPPMAEEVEYCTSERYEGKPVYVKKFWGEMPPIPYGTLNRYHYISGIATKKTKIISFQANAKPSYHNEENINTFTVQQFPFFDNNGKLIAKMRVDSSAIRVVSFTDKVLSDYEWEAVIKYIKV